MCGRWDVGGCGDGWVREVEEFGNGGEGREQGGDVVVSKGGRVVERQVGIMEQNHTVTDPVLRLEQLYPSPPPIPCPLQLLYGRIPTPTPILPHLLLPRPLILLKRLHLRAIHMLHDLIGLPLLETKPEPLVAVVFVVGLVFVVFDADEVGVFGGRVEGERDEGVDGGRFGDDSEGPGL